MHGTYGTYSLISFQALFVISDQKQNLHRLNALRIINAV